MLLKKSFFAVAGLVFSAVISLTLFVQPSRVSATSPFSCQPGFYQVISGQLNILNPLTGVYTPIGSQGDTYNAIGFNPVDNYIYGWGTSGAISGQIIRVSSDGSLTTMGNAGQTGTSFISADFDDEGFLWMRKNSTTLVKVDVRQNPATSTEVTFTGSNLIGADMGWINDTLFAVDAATLMKADLTTSTVTHATITDLNSPSGKEFPGTGNYGAVFSNRADELYVSRNENGMIYRITDYNTSNPKATFVVEARQTSNNDGAACKLAPSPFDTPTASNDTYATTNDSALNVGLLNGIFSNDGSSSPTVISHTNPSSGTLTLNSNGSFTYTPDPNFVGDVTFSYVGQDQWGRTMPSATVTITVRAPAGATATSPSVAPSVTSTKELPAAGSSGSQIFPIISLLLAGSVSLLARRALLVRNKNI